VYALDEFLPIVETFGDFVPAGPEGLYQEGYFSAVAPANN
jgi:hypothetical protein